MNASGIREIVEKGDFRPVVKTARPQLLANYILQYPSCEVGVRHVGAAHFRGKQAPRADPAAGKKNEN